MKFQNLTQQDFQKFLSLIDFNVIITNKITHFFNVKDEDCWNFTGPKDRDGYGKFKALHAQRFSYYFYNYINPIGLLVCHSCDNPGCVNPRHLWLGTIQDNENDKTKKGRRPIITGDMVSNKMTSEFVRKMFDDIDKNVYLDIQDISDNLGISIENIRFILNGKQWKNVILTLPKPLKYYKDKVTSRLLPNDVINIYNKYYYQNYSTSNLMIEYNLSRQTIRNICNKKCWKEILKDL